MNKQEFLDKLKARLSNLPERDAEEYLNFYSEMIDDRIEEGLSEEEAVFAIGSVDEAAKQVAADIPLAKIAKERIKPNRRLKVWEILLLVLGSPIWVSLMIAAFAVLIAFYASLWSVVVSLWAVFASLIACAVGGVLSGAVFACGAYVLSGIATISAGIVCVGLSVFMFYGCKAATNGMLILTKKFAICIKNCFIKKEGA